MMCRIIQIIQIVQIIQINEPSALKDLDHEHEIEHLSEVWNPVTSPPQVLNSLRPVSVLTHLGLYR